VLGTGEEAKATTHFALGTRMLDIYRFVLALFVIQGHILAWRPHWLAWQAVFSFYVLSGFLMTLVLNEAYGFAFSGILRFATNRWLRLFPMYFAVIGLTALYLAAVGPLSNLNSAIALPSSPRSLLANISIVGLLGFDPKRIATIRLAPTAWSLGIELFCYGLLAVYFAKSVARLLMMLLVGAVVTGMQIVGALGEADYGFQGHYTVLQAGLVPFAMGGLAYFAREAAIFRFAWWKLFLLGALFFANVLAGYAFEFHRGVSGLYVAALLNVFLVPMLFAMPTYAWCKTTGGRLTPSSCHTGLWRR
jgi:peptidoglycan/LPS O-acetylase OafA/YrhL